MSRFIKENIFPIVISVLIGLSSYLLERTVSHQVQIQQIQQEISTLKQSVRTIAELMIRRKND